MVLQQLFLLRLGFMYIAIFAIVHQLKSKVSFHENTIVL